MCYNFYFYKLLPWIWQSRIYIIFMIIWIYFFKNHIMQGATPCIEMEMAWWWINWPFHGLTDVPEQAIHTSKLPFLQYYLLTYIRDGWGIDPIRPLPSSEDERLTQVRSRGEGLVVHTIFWTQAKPDPCMPRHRRQPYLLHIWWLSLKMIDTYY